MRRCGHPGTVAVMDDMDGYLGPDVAAAHDGASAQAFQPQIINPALDVLTAP
jgi:hypothetical protein